MSRLEGAYSKASWRNIGMDENLYSETEGLDNVYKYRNVLYIFLLEQESIKLCPLLT